MTLTEYRKGRLEQRRLEVMKRRLEERSATDVPPILQILERLREIGANVEQHQHSGATH